MEQLPNIFSSDAGNWSTDRWQAEWLHVQKTWIPSEAQLGQLSDGEIEVMALCTPLPIGASDEEFSVAVRRKNLAGLEFGRRQGWWTGFSKSGPNVTIETIKVDDWNQQTMAHLVVHLGWFPSVSQARKNGWDRPVEPGVFRMGKTRAIQLI
jgi:hypothetical protein